MISEIRPLPAGAALQLALQPPVGAVAWRILRNGVDAFAGPDDPLALKVYEGVDVIVLDAMPGMVNQSPMFYRPYYLIAGVWTAGPSASGTPNATYEDRTTDVLALVRDRLEEGLKEEVKRKTFVFSDARGIEVFDAPPMVKQVELPVVTITMEGEDPGARGVGELIDIDEREPDGGWLEFEGWLADVKLEITGWCDNPEQRSEMRRALRRILVANLPVFDAAGMTQIQVSFRHADLTEGQFEMNVHQVVCSFSCQAPVKVGAPQRSITSAQVTASGEFPPTH